MTTSNPIDLAAEIVTSFVSNNSIPRGELPALIEAARSIGFDVVTVVLTAIYFASPRLRDVSRLVDSRRGKRHQFLHPN